MMRMKAYLITDPAYYGRDTAYFSAQLSKVLRCHRPWAALFRDKEDSLYPLRVEHFVRTVRDASTQTLAVVHSDLAAALDAGADALHLPMPLLARTGEAKKAGLRTIVSVHSFEEACAAEQAGADFVTLSPFFASPGKGAPLDLVKINEILATINTPIIALGGIVGDTEIAAVSRLGIDYFASIRYFVHPTHI